MAVNRKCPCAACGTNIEFPAEYEGREMACPNCNSPTTLVVPKYGSATLKLLGSQGHQGEEKVARTTPAQPRKSLPLPPLGMTTSSSRSTRSRTGEGIDRDDDDSSGVHPLLLAGIFLPLAWLSFVCLIYLGFWAPSDTETWIWMAVFFASTLLFVPLGLRKIGEDRQGNWMAALAFGALLALLLGYYVGKIIGQEKGSYINLFTTVQGYFSPVPGDVVRYIRFSDALSVEKYEQDAIKEIEGHLGRRFFIDGIRLDTSCELYISTIKNTTEPKTEKLRRLHNQVVEAAEDMAKKFRIFANTLNRDEIAERDLRSAVKRLGECRAELNQYLGQYRR